MLRDEFQERLLCSEEDYWRVALNPSFQQELYLKHMGYRDFQVREVVDGPDQMSRVYFCDPRPSAVPSVVSKLMPDSSWEERITFDRKSRLYAITYVTSSMPDRVTLAAEVSCRADSGVLLQCVSASIEVKLGPLSSWMERAILADVLKTLRETASKVHQKIEANRVVRPIHGQTIAP